MNDKKIQTIIFDLGGVVFTDGTSETIAFLCQKYNLPYEKVDEFFNGQWGSFYRTGKIDIYSFWNRIRSEFHINENVDSLANTWHSFYMLQDDVFQIINELKTKKYELLFLSDNVKERVNYLQKRYHFLNWFDDGIFSFTVGMRKTDYRIFELILKKTNTPARNCIYIDNVEKFNQIARTLNFNTILFKDGYLLKESFKTFGITI